MQDLSTSPALLTTQPPRVSRQLCMNLGMKEFVKPWQVCPNCRQVYQNELRIHIAAEFVCRSSEGSIQTIHKNRWEALYLKLRALNLMIGKTTVARNREAGVTANVLLSLIDRMKHDVLSPLSMRYYEFKANVYATLGNIALAEGTEESARRAVAHFENQPKVNEVTGNVDGIACSKSNIEMAKTRFEGDRKYEESLKRYQELYALRVSESGERNEYTIIAGINYAILLQRSKGAEASCWPRASKSSVLITISPRPSNQLSNRLLKFTINIDGNYQISLFFRSFIFTYESGNNPIYF
jgi:hypothetical protein